MSCSNCYNGCPQIISDQCVKYTGIDIPVLGIKNGDSLSYVEQAIITFLTSTLDGTGIKPNIEQSIICQIVSKYLPTCGDLTVVDFIKALTQAVCELKTLVDGTIADIEEINDFIASLESAYDVSDCLTGVTSTSGTHDVLQAVIDTLCLFIRDAPDTYVQLQYLDDLIAAYLAGTTAATKYYTRMVPYMATPFFPTPAVLAKFNNGVGQDEWEKIYLCNGANGTPDLRGRVPVGVTDGTMGGGTLPTEVNPASSPLNPNYTISTAVGANGTTLITSQLPSHTHTGSATSTSTATISPNPHSHSFTYTTRGTGSGVGTIGTSGTNSTKVTTDQSLSVSVSTVTSITNANTGGNEAHSNVQPGIGCYYIMYIP